MDKISTFMQGKTALVGGASQGIGQATAMALAEMGAKVIALARSEKKLDELVTRLPGTGHSYIACDVGERARLRAMVTKALESSGSIDVLICNAGGPKGGPIELAQDAQFEEAIAHHLLANSALAQICLPGMKEKRWGRIVNIISTSVRIPIPGLGVSNVARAAVAAWAKTLSLEVAAFGITVNSVLPGYTKTPRLESLLAANSEKTGKSRASVESEWRASIPAGRFGEPEEVAAAIAFLASPAASYINGICLTVDGGRTGSL